MRLFVHIPKCGGMTIRKGIPERIIVASSGNHISPQYTAELHNTMAAAGEHHGYEHARWRDFRKDLRDKYQALAIVRNPWARAVSRYTFSVVAEKNDYTFAEFLDERHIYGGIEYYWHRAIRGWYPMLDYVTDESGALRCDILRFGTSDIERYFDLTGPLAIRNISNIDGKDYREFYGPEEYDIIADWYSSDIEFFRFTFDGDATRNIWTLTL
jgi:hypothetical protein